MLDPDLTQLLNGIHQDQSDLQAKLVAADRAAELDLTSLEWLLRFLVGMQQNTECSLLSTGSRTYGTPTEESDWDWVLHGKWTVRAGVNIPNLISERSDRRHGGEGEKCDYGELEPAIEGAYRFGPVNILLVLYNRQWKSWEDGTIVLVREKAEKGPVSRERAIEIMEEMRTKYLELLPVEDSHFPDDVL